MNPHVGAKPTTKHLELRAPWSTRTLNWQGGGGRSTSEEWADRIADR
jgi:hypothetical protein